MRPANRFAPRGLLLLLGLWACRAKTPTGPTEGMLEARWSDSLGRADFRAPADARWCARDTSLEILAARRDSAFGLSLYARDSLRVEGYPVFLAAMFAPWR